MVTFFFKNGVRVLYGMLKSFILLDIFNMLLSLTRVSHKNVPIKNRRYLAFCKKLL